MTHDPMALIIAGPLLILAVWAGWTSFRISFTAKPDTLDES